MIQTANIGIGIFGNEGNQAAAFSDYAIPKFKCLRRLVFWHGRQFGKRATVYIPISVFKGHLFMAMTLFLNT